MIYMGRCIAYISYMGVKLCDAPLSTNRSINVPIMLPCMYIIFSLYIASELFYCDLLDI